MSDAIRAALIFLVNTLFDLYLFVLVVRIILVYVQSNYYDPITHFIAKITDPLVKPIRKLIPNFRGVELSALLIVIVLEMIKFYLIAIVSIGMPNIVGLLILAIADTIKIGLLSFFYAILIQVILSWVQPHSPILHTLSQFTSPLMRPFHRLLPPVSGFDISPIFALILLQVLLILIVNPLMGAGMGVAFG